MFFGISSNWRVIFNMGTCIMVSLQDYLNKRLTELGKVYKRGKLSTENIKADLIESGILTKSGKVRILVGNYGANK